MINEDHNNDIVCDSPILLVQHTSGQATPWRCSTGIVLLGDSSYPFIPWPEYHHGKSQHLTLVLDTLKSQMKSVVKTTGS
ncbi:hypothetical protein C9426_24145 [Serratia sp. S1B]|nr:hypothetical protein C9426_24145 [Serratia sp. S1B]